MLWRLDSQSQNATVCVVASRHSLEHLTYRYVVQIIRYPVQCAFTVVIIIKTRKYNWAPSLPETAEKYVQRQPVSRT